MPISNTQHFKFHAALQAHVAGRKHRRRVEANMGRGTIKQSPHYCALCDISTTSAAHLALHLVGRAHRRRQKAMEDSDFPHLLPARAVAQRGDMELLENAIGERHSFFFYSLLSLCKLPELAFCITFVAEAAVNG